MKKRFYWLFLVPSLLGFMLFFIIPLVFSLYYALIENMGNRRFAGLKHFIETLHNELYLTAAKNTLVFLAISVTLSMAISLLLALALQRLHYGQAIAASILLLPMAIPSGATVQFWKILFDFNGLFNKLLLLAGISHERIVQSQWEMGTIVVVFLWKNVSYNMVLFCSGLHWIPKSYYEQMHIDGAGMLQCFFNVTWIYLQPTTFIVLLMSIVNSFKVFKEIQMLYGAYPSTNIYMLQHYMNNQFVSMDIQKLTSAVYLMLLVLGCIVVILFQRQRHLTDLYE